MMMGKKMRKVIALLVALIASVWSIPAAAVGTISFSLSQQLDANGAPLGGCLFYTIVAGTTSTPQTAYQDTGLTIPLPNPMTCDASGRLPQFFLADGQIKIRLTDKFGNQVLVADNILVIGPSSGVGGGGSVDPTTVLQTGDFKMEYGTGPIAGFVRCNGRTIGSATSGASERANADTSALYSFLWGVDPNLAVTGGRGANAAADFAANKSMALPDCRGRVLAGLDDMGNAAAGRLTAGTIGIGGPTTLGGSGGQEQRALVTANLPPYTPSGFVSTTSSQTAFPTGLYNISPGGSGTALWGTSVGTSTSWGISSSSTFTGTAQGGVAANFGILQPTLLITDYIKL